MDVVITIHDEDLMLHPEIFDLLKDFAKKIADSRPELWSGPEPIGFCAPDESQAITPANTGGYDPEQEAPVETKAEASAASEQEAPAEPVAEEGAEVTISIEEVRAAIAQVNKKHGAAKAKGILQKFGAESMSALDKKYYAAALEEAKGAL